MRVLTISTFRLPSHPGETEQNLRENDTFSGPFFGSQKSKKWNRQKHTGNDNFLNRNSKTHESETHCKAANFGVHCGIHVGVNLGSIFGSLYVVHFVRTSPTECLFLETYRDIEREAHVRLWTKEELQASYWMRLLVACVFRTSTRDMVGTAYNSHTYWLRLRVACAPRTSTRDLIAGCMHFVGTIGRATCI